MAEADFFLRDGYVCAYVVMGFPPPSGTGDVAETHESLNIKRQW
jgi:hypothetical protein